MTTAAQATILLVEDDTLLRDAFQLLLEDAGYRVLEAGSATQALEHTAACVPSLILLDLGLPDRPGLDVARELRTRDDMRDVPIIALTGRVGADEQQECLDAGCTLYIAKPIGPRELLRQLREMLPQS
jgi:DNA-binding response OmpR family regulator